MSSRSPKLGRIIRGILLGLSATLIVAAAHFAGVGEQAERWALDFRFRNLPTLSPRDDIVHIDIDDQSLDKIGRWPWPRRRLAQLIDSLNTCGAKVVVLDIILPEPQEPRYVKEGFTDLYMADTETVFNPDAPPRLVLDDVELAAALSASPNLFLAMHIDIIKKTPRQRGKDLTRIIANIVATRPVVTLDEIAAELHLDLPVVEEAIPRAREIAYNRRIEALLRDRPERSLKEVLARLSGQIIPGSREFDVARRIYLRRQALHVLKRFALSESRISSETLPTGRAIPPLVTFAREMSHTGCVTINPDEDGVVRRVPLLVKTDSGVFGQLALIAAAEALAKEHGGKYEISAQSGKVVITGEKYRREIPVDENGYMLINWTQDTPDNPVARHIPAFAVAEVWQATESLRNNKNLYFIACEKMSVLIPHVFEGKAMRKYFVEDAEISRKIHLARQARQSALLFRPTNVPEIPGDLLKQQADLDKTIERGCKETLAFIDDLLAGADEAGGRPDETEKKVRSLRTLIRQIERQQQEIHRQLSSSIQRVRKEVSGKICFIGSSATGAADFIPTPVHRRVPGVNMHANIYNTILSGKFVHTPSGWISAVLIILTGMLVALVTATRGPIESAIVLVAAIVGYAFVDASVWKGWDYWIVSATPVATMLLVFTVITVYRQLTEQRQRRQITSTFKQYLSPAMVDELVQDPTQASLGGQKRQLSCLFADLAGFTTISERLGAEGTVGLLNRYLDRVGDILQGRYGGTLSKYEGDGIFAFFGAPIPQDDHARRAILSAIDCQAFLPELNRELHNEQFLPEGDELSARIGITAGEVFVGNMGSTQRVAYTAIGDAVNLAARLESANKFFGSRIMVNDEAWKSVEGELIGRPLGKIIVVGKTEPVSVWEPLDRKANADDKLRKLAEDFTRGVELYAAGDFQTAREQFQTILAERDDPAARRYLQLSDAGPNQAEFDGIIRLAEK